MWLLALFGGAVVVGGTALMVIVDRARGAQRRMPATKIATVDGSKKVRVHGIVQTRGTLVAPYSRRPCVYFKIVIRIDATDAGVEDIERASDFDFRDDSGTAHIVAGRAVFEVVTDIFEIDRFSSMTHAAHAMFEELGISIPSRIGSVEIREGIIALGDAIDVVGQPVCEPSKEINADERGYRETRMMPVFSEALVFGEAREPQYVGRRN